MRILTNDQENITDDTKLIINGREVLDKHGIRGNIAMVGIGFGTGRHSCGRRGMGAFLEERKSFSSPKRKFSPKKRTVVHSIGCDPMPIDLNSQRSHVPIQELKSQCLSAWSISKYDAAEGISAGRFEYNDEVWCQTDDRLWQLYLQKQMKNAEIGTDPF